MNIKINPSNTLHLKLFKSSIRKNIEIKPSDVPILYPPENANKFKEILKTEKEKEDYFCKKSYEYKPENLHSNLRLRKESYAFLKEVSEEDYIKQAKPDYKKPSKPRKRSTSITHEITNTGLQHIFPSPEYLTINKNQKKPTPKNKNKNSKTKTKKALSSCELHYHQFDDCHKMKHMMQVNNMLSLTLQSVIRFIDGTNTIQFIANQANVDVKLVLNAVLLLVFYDIVNIIDIFQYSNFYMLTSSFKDFAANMRLRAKCAQFIYIPQVELKGLEDTDSPQRDGKTKKLLSYKVISLYNKLHLASNVSEFLHQITENEQQCLANSMTMEGLQGSDYLSNSMVAGTKGSFNLGGKANLVLSNVVNVRNLISFGIIHGFLRRIHKYAICERDFPIVGCDPEESKLNKKIRPLLNGLNTFDQICSGAKMSVKDVEKYLNRYKQSIHTFYK